MADLDEYDLGHLATVKPNTRPELVAIEPIDDERVLMVHSLNEYFGAAKSAKPLLSSLLGLSNTDEFHSLLHRLVEAIEAKVPLSELDWARSLLLTEICSTSDLLGAGIDFATNFRDEEAAPLLRSLQRKVSSFERFAVPQDIARVTAIDYRESITIRPPRRRPVYRDRWARPEIRGRSGLVSVGDVLCG